jgi:signal transduction histidine kinase
VATIVSTLRSVFKDKANETKFITLCEFIDGLKPLIEAELGSRSIRLGYDLPKALRVIFNEGELTLVLLNLVNNAAKAGAKTIRIRAEVIGNNIALSVEDDGSGVSDDVLPHLFEITKETETNGLGLGLWLSKYIVERGGGSITYTARTPNGSVFTLNIP